jgi:hypothetical protein
MQAVSQWPLCFRSGIVTASKGRNIVRNFFQNSPGNKKEKSRGSALCQVLRDITAVLLKDAHTTKGGVINKCAPAVERDGVSDFGEFRSHLPWGA